MKRRLTACLLALLLALIAAARAEVPDYGTLAFGAYEQNGDADDGAEPLEWLILDDDGESLLCIARYAIDNVPYQNASGDTDWADSDLRAWLNGPFIEAAFSESERSRIVPVTLANESNPDHGTAGGADTTDRVFLLDVQQVNRYFPTAESRLALPTEAVRDGGVLTVHDNCLWRLRTPGRSGHHAVVVLTTGEYDYCGLNVSYDLAGIRPAMWIAKPDADGEPE